MRYVNSISPSELTINELAERQMFIDEAKEMAITSPDNLSDLLKSHRRTVLIAEQHEASLRGAKPEVEAPFEINEDEFESHDDCDIQDCFECYEAAVGRAESAAEGER